MKKYKIKHWKKEGKVWQNVKNERGGSKKANESRSVDSEVFELASRHHTARLFWNPIMRI